MPLRIRDVSLYTVRDVAYRLGIADGTVRKYLREGKMVGRKHAGAWHVTEESFRVFLRGQGDDLSPDDLPQIVIQIPAYPDEANDDSTRELEPLDERPETLDELAWLLLEARRLHREARRLEILYVDSSLPPIET